MSLGGGWCLFGLEARCVALTDVYWTLAKISQKHEAFVFLRDFVFDFWKTIGT